MGHQMSAGDRHRWRTFQFVLVSQVLSGIGSEVAAFAVRVWLFHQGVTLVSSSSESEDVAAYYDQGLGQDDEYAFLFSFVVVGSGTLLAMHSVLRQIIVLVIAPIAGALADAAGNVSFKSPPERDSRKHSQSKPTTTSSDNDHLHNQAHKQTADSRDVNNDLGTGGGSIGNGEIRMRRTRRRAEADSRSHSPVSRNDLRQSSSRLVPAVERALCECQSPNNVPNVQRIARRRRLIVVTDFLQLALTLATFYLAAHQMLTVGRVFALQGASSALAALQWPITEAFISDLLRPLGRNRVRSGTGLIEVGGGIAQLLAPIVGALLASRDGLASATLLDAVTCIIGTAALAFAPLGSSFVQCDGDDAICQPATCAEEARSGATAATVGSTIRASTSSAESASMWSRAQLVEGWTFFKHNSAAMGLLTLLAVSNFVDSVIVELLPVLILRLYDAETLGSVSSFCGIGMVLGSIVVAMGGAWLGRSRPSSRVFWSLSVQALLMLASFSNPTPLPIAASGFAYLFLDPIISAASSELWIAKTPPRIAGRVAAFRGFIIGCFATAGTVVCGPVADLLEVKFNNGQSSWSHFSVVRFFGLGNGRGICAVFFVVGVMFSIFIFVFGCSLRQIELMLDYTAESDDDSNHDD